MSDYPQVMLQNAARMFIADLNNSGHTEAAAFLQQKYIDAPQYEGRRINYIPPAPHIKPELIEG